MFNNNSNIAIKLEKIQTLQTILIERATGGSANEEDFVELRKEFISHPKYRSLAPEWLIKTRSLDQFWQFIKPLLSRYAERREFIYESFQDLIAYIELDEQLPSNNNIIDALVNFNSTEIYDIWYKAIERKTSDPDGAITIARTMLESVCKNILEKKQVEYNSTNIELSELYKIVATQLNLAPDQHTEKIFKQILGGCSGIINGLGTLRNKLGDAHGKGLAPVKPKPRHAELAVNLAGSMALYLVSTYEETNNS